MSNEPRSEVTRLLEAVEAGDEAASGNLFPLVYDELRRLASSLIARERGPVTLQPTALVHEAYMRLVGVPDLEWKNRAHFFNTAARAMRRILIDRARHIKAARVPQTPLEGEGPAAAGPDEGALSGDDLLRLDSAMERLKTRDERQHDVVMLRYFAGLTIDQTAAAMGLSPATVKNEWVYARAWLMREMASADASGGGA
ncbi:MAG: ECF-type sigma factor [Phycisphaerales bacterium]